MRDLNFKDPGSYASGIVRPEWIPQGGHAESASNPGWEPLGNNSNRFRAIFEGNGHTIVNLYINNSKEVYLGLINITSLKAEIRNLGLINSTVRGESYAGGLVGLNDLGTITACYATDGKSISRGRDSVGGLVGYNAGIITKSHTTGVMSGTDNRASIGGLVRVNSGTIVASYSEGVMFGTTYIACGGLVEINLGTIVASYSTGVTSGRIHAFLGGLVGFNIGTITASYAMGGTSGTADNSSVRGLIGVNSGTVNESYWNRVSTGQETSAGGRGLSTAEMLATNGSYPDFGTFNPAWRHCLGYYPRLKTWLDAGADNTPGTSDDSYSETLLFGQEETCSPDQDRDGKADILDVDDDNDGLIEIETLEDLDNIRYNLAGTSYKRNPDDPGSTVGAPESGLRGYELIRDLDFADSKSYASYETNPKWRPGINEDNTPVGWEPLGGARIQLSATLEGNGHTIKNLYIKRDKQYNIGLIGYLGKGAEVRNLGLLGVHVEGQNSVGALVGFNAGMIISSYAIGKIKGASLAGGLVGYNLGSILGSYVSGSIEGNEDVGGLVGFNKGKITASYSTGSVEGIERVGGLVGAYYSKQTPYIGNAIRGSYSVSSVRGERDTGGIIGLFDRGGVIESYWDRQSTGQETSSRGGMGLSTAEMVGTRGTYPDFGSYSGAWEHTEGSYPRLKIWIGRGADNRAGTTDDDYSENLLEGQTDNIPLPPPPPFRNIQVNVRGSGVVYFSWLTPSSLDYAGVFMEWEDDLGGSGQEEFERKDISYQRDHRGELYSYIVGNGNFLIPGKNYTIRLYAYNERRRFSEAVRIKIPLKIPPAPTNVVFYEEGEKIRVDWEPGGEEEVDGYLIFLVRETRDDSSYTTQAEKTEIEIDRESSGLGSNRSDYSILVCSFRSIEPIIIGGSVVESGEFSLGEERLIGVSRAFAMRVVSADVTAQPCFLSGCSSNPPSPTLTISATNIACAGDTIEVTIDGENLGGRTNTVTGGAKKVSRVGPGTVEVKMPAEPGMVTLMISIGSASASKTIKVIGADDVKITSIGFKLKDGDLTNHLPSKPGKMIGIFSNKTLEFKPITDPANFEGKLGELTWSGEASGEGTTNIIKFSSEGNFDVSLVRGDNTNTASVKVVNKPTGIGQEAYYILYNRFARRATASNLLPSLLHLAAAVMLGERPPTEPERWANETYANTPSLINAARHAYWIMSLKVFVDPGFAEGAGMAHEVSGADENPAYDTIVDLHNNKVAFDSIEESQVTGDNITNKRTFLQNKVKALISNGELLHHNKIGLIMKTSMTDCD